MAGSANSYRPYCLWAYRRRQLSFRHPRRRTLLCLVSFVFVFQLPCVVGRALTGPSTGG